VYRIEIIELVADISDWKYLFFYSMMKQGGTAVVIVPGKSENFYQGFFLPYRK